MRSVTGNDTRKLILETARTLLRRFGADKLTVVDIARALDMSHANVYRFFKNKSEILDAIVDEWMSKMEAFIEAIAQRPAPAADRIEAVVLELHRRRRQKLLEDAEVYETFRRVVEMRPDVIAQRREKIVNVFKRLVEEGIKSGEFAPVDVDEAATVLKDATALFLHPFMIPTTLKEETDDRAKNIVRYILAGFSATKPKTDHRRAVAGAAVKATAS